MFSPAGFVRYQRLVVANCCVCTGLLQAKTLVSVSRSVVSYGFTYIFSLCHYYLGSYEAYDVCDAYILLTRASFCCSEKVAFIFNESCIYAHI